MGAKVTSSRKLTVHGDTKEQNITLAHLEGLVSMARAADYPDDALVVLPSAVNGIGQISVRQGAA